MEGRRRKNGALRFMNFSLVHGNYRLSEPVNKAIVVGVSAVTAPREFFAFI